MNKFTLNYILIKTIGNKINYNGKYQRREFQISVKKFKIKKTFKTVRSYIYHSVWRCALGLVSHYAITKGSSSLKPRITGESSSSKTKF